MELSKRLKAVAGLVTEGASVADIGTDHGYVPIWLIQSGRAAKVIAMDVNEGPLERARGHIRSKRLENVIFTRKSDGLQALHVGEADTMIAAGMGGGLVIRILENSPEITADLKEFILQPQSEIHKVREYLNRHGYRSAGRGYGRRGWQILSDDETGAWRRSAIFTGGVVLWALTPEEKESSIISVPSEREHSLKKGIADRLGDQTGKGAESETERASRRTGTD